MWSRLKQVLGKNTKQLSGKPAPKSKPQLRAYEKFKRYKKADNAVVLEIGGNRNCLSALPFVADGARRVIVSGLGHVETQTSVEQGVELRHLNAFDMVKDLGEQSLDFVYGINILEHIPITPELMQQIYAALKPGGMVYLQGGPLWSSPRGHHIWLTRWKDGTSANYLFLNNPNIVSSNPIPDWGHLLMEKDEMGSYLLTRQLPAGDVDKIIEWIYEGDAINRISYNDLARTITRSEFTLLEVNPLFRKPLPAETLIRLQQKFNQGLNFDAGGVEFVLLKE